MKKKEKIKGFRKIIMIFSIPLILVSLMWPYSFYAEAQASSLILTPDSYTTTSGTGGGQTVDALKVKDQSGKADDPNKYVLFAASGSPYQGKQVFIIPDEKANLAVSDMALRVNFKGASKPGQKWTWSIYDPGKDSWTKLGTKTTSRAGTWTSSKFHINNPGLYFKPQSEIIIMLSSNTGGGNAKIDYEAISIAFQDGAAITQGLATPTSGSSDITVPTDASSPTSRSVVPSSVTSTSISTNTSTATVSLTATPPAVVNTATNTPAAVPSATISAPSETAVSSITPTAPTPTLVSDNLNPVLRTETASPTATGAGDQQVAGAATSVPPVKITETPPAKASSLPPSTPLKGITDTPTPKPTLTPSPTFNPNGTIYYVATSGNDSNAGILSSPFLTVQKCLNVVKPGGACYIRGGTYNEALTLKASGTASGPITIRNYNGEVVTINSGGSKTIQTTNTRQSYYVFDGLRLISSITGVESTKTIDFQNGWTIGYNHAPPEGNSYITLQNCYVEGEVTFYGQNNTVSNCEFNGKNSLGEAIHINYPPSVGNIVKNNIIHDYTARGVWSMGGSDSTLITGNNIYNTPLGVDCDGAGVPVTNCDVMGNVIHDISSSAGIFSENNFGGVLNGNYIYNIPNGSGIFVINYGNGPSWHTQGNIEYRTQDLNAYVTNNVIFNNPASPGILDTSASGVKIYNNTLYSSGTGSMIYLKVEPGTTFYPHNEFIRNNIFYDRSTTATIRMDDIASLTGSTFSNNLFWTGTNTHKIGNISYTLAGFQATGQEAGSIFADPKFAVPGSDFRLQAGSPAIDKGFNTGVAYDILGVTRPRGAGYDIGAYEH